MYLTQPSVPKRKALDAKMTTFFYLSFFFRYFVLFSFRRRVFASTALNHKLTLLVFSLNIHLTKIFAKQI